MVWCNIHPRKGQTSISQTGNTTARGKYYMRPFMLKCISPFVQRSRSRLLLSDMLRVHLISVQSEDSNASRQCASSAEYDDCHIPFDSFCKYSCRDNMSQLLSAAKGLFPPELSPNQDQICFPSSFI